MNAVEVSFKIFKEIDKALDLGYNRIYMNVDNQFNGFGFLRVLARKEMEYFIIYEGTFQLNECYHILDLLNDSKYDIKDFTINLDDD